MDSIDGYKILRELGRGGMGAVYEVEKNSQRYALKLLLDQSPESALRFQQEARILASIDKDLPVIRCHSFGMSPAGPYMVMERIEGSTLKELIQAGPLRFDRALQFAAETSDIVSKLHERGIIHRDIKADNVFILANGQLRLGDFGLARKGAGEGLTQSQDLLGTPYAMAPEALDSASLLGPASDVWALAVLLYELLSAERPFQGQNNFDLLRKITEAEYSPISQRLTQLADRDELDRLFQSCFQRDPSLRPSAVEFSQLCRDTRSRLHGPRALRLLKPILILLAFVALLSLAITLDQSRRDKAAKTQRRLEIFHRALRLETSLDAELPNSFEDWLYAALAPQLGEGPPPRDPAFEQEWKALAKLSHELPDHWPWPQSSPAARLKARLLGLYSGALENTNNDELELWEYAVSRMNEQPRTWEPQRFAAIVKTPATKFQKITDSNRLARFVIAALQLQNKIDLDQRITHTATILEFQSTRAQWISHFCDRLLLERAIEQSRHEPQLSKPNPELFRDSILRISAQESLRDTSTDWLELNDRLSSSLLNLPSDIFATVNTNWLLYSSIHDRLLWPALSDSQHLQIYSECLRRVKKSKDQKQSLLWQYRACIHWLATVPYEQGMSNQDGALFTAYHDLSTAGASIVSAMDSNSRSRGRLIASNLIHALRAGVVIGRDYIFADLITSGLIQQGLSLWPRPAQLNPTALPTTLLRARLPYLFVLAYGTRPHNIPNAPDWRKLKNWLAELSISFQRDPTHYKLLEAILSRRFVERLRLNADEALRLDDPARAIQDISEALGFSTIPELLAWGHSHRQRSIELACEHPLRVQMATALLDCSAAQVLVEPERSTTLLAAAESLESLLFSIEFPPEGIESSFWAETVFYGGQHLADARFALKQNKQAAEAARFAWRVLARANVDDRDLGELLARRLREPPTDEQRATIIAEWTAWLRALPHSDERPRRVQTFEDCTGLKFQ